MTRARLMHLALGALVCWWCVFTFRHYLPALDQAAFKQILATTKEATGRWGMIDALLVAWMALSAGLVGERFLRLFPVNLPARLERRWFAVTLGLSLFSLAAFALGACHLLYRGAAWSMLILPLALIRRKTSEPPRTERTVVDWLLISFTVVTLSITLVSALGPEIEFDALMIHLAAAKAAAQSHGLGGLPNVPQTFMPKHVTLLFSLGLLLRSQVAAKLINFLFGLLICTGVYTLARRIASRQAGLVAAAIMVCSPIFLWEIRTAHVDAGMGLFVFLSLYATVIWLESGEQPWFWLAVYTTAFSQGTKFHAMYAMGALATIVFFHRFALKRGFLTAAKDSVRFFLYSACGLIPWGIVAWIQTGNPVFPLLGKVFKSPYWTPLQQARNAESYAHNGIAITPHTWWALFTNVWSMVMDQQGLFAGNIGIFCLMLIPLLLLQRRVSVSIKLILGFSAAYYLFWSFTAQWGRYFMGALPGLVVVAGCSLEGWLRLLRERVHRFAAVATAALLLAIGALNTPLLESYGVSARYGSGMLETMPVKLLMGYETKDQYLARYLRDYPAVAHLNSLPGKKKVLFWWNTTPIGYYLNGEMVSVASSLFELLQEGEPAKIHDTLIQNGVTHVIAGQLGQEGSPLVNPEDLFVRRYLRPIYRGNATIVYEIAPQALQQEQVVFSFLNHLGEAVAKPKPVSAGVWGLGGDQRYAMLTFPPAEVTFLVAVPDRAVIRFGVGRMFPPCEAKGTFALQANGKQVYQREINSQIPQYEAGWYDEEVDLAAYAGQPVSFTFQSTTTVPGACDWFMWADPRIISKETVAK